MSQMKDQLKDDLTAAMKSRDELTAATLRMALTAITNEEVAGKEARTREGTLVAETAARCRSPIGFEERRFDLESTNSLRSDL